MFVLACVLYVVSMISVIFGAACTAMGLARTMAGEKGKTNRNLAIGAIVSLVLAMSYPIFYWLTNGQYVHH